MALHKLLLPDGSSISSGPGEAVSLQKVTLTQKVNSQQALCCGSVFASCLEATLFCPEQNLPLRADTRLELYREEEKLGVFYVDTLEKTGKGIYKLTAFDSLRLLDGDISTWLSGLPHWPYTLQELAQMTCQQCGLALKEGDMPQGDFPASPVEGREITGRMVLSWIGQAIGRFCRATVDGQVEFAWYTPRDVLLEPAGDAWYFQGSFQREEEIAPIDQVQIRESSTDVGVLYPADKKGNNVYVVEGNPLLSPENSQSLLGIAQSLYETLSPIVYTPGSVAVPGSLDIGPGQIVQVKDAQGKAHTFYAMGRVRSGQKDTLSCQGVHSREKAQVTNRQDIRALSGKVLHLQMDVDGVLAQNRDAAGSMAQMELEIGSIRAQVRQRQEEGAALKTQLSALEQNSQKVELRLSQMEEHGADKVETSTGYRFDKDGLWISKSGEEMENRLDNTGMYVRRSGQVILQANNQGVVATDVTVRNYLTVGEHARLEDYSSGSDSFRTACFWIGGAYGGI